MRIEYESVYILTNKINGRKYVGRSRSPEYRKKQHLSGLKNGYHNNELMLEDSFTYGYESFDFIVFGTYASDEASRMEIFMMKLLRTQDKRFGYNYKDRSGYTKFAIQDKWRTPPHAWEQAWRAKYLSGETNWRVNRLPYHESEPIDPNRFF